MKGRRQLNWKIIKSLFLLNAFSSYCGDIDISVQHNSYIKKQRLTGLLLVNWTYGSFSHANWLWIWRLLPLLPTETMQTRFHSAKTFRFNLVITWNMTLKTECVDLKPKLTLRQKNYVQTGGASLRQPPPKLPDIGTGSAQEIELIEK